MKTIIARFQELKTAVGDSIEVDGELVDVNKVDTALKSVGVQLRDSLTGQFRDLDDVFLELASKWDTLDRNTQRYIATIAAGSRQQSRFIAMMDNYERTLELVDIAQNSNGASAAQFAKTLDSVEAKMNNIKASFEEFIGTVVGSDLVKGFLDAINSVLQMIDGIAKKGTAAVTVFGVFFIAMIKKIVSNIFDTTKTVSGLLNAVWEGTGSKFSKEMKEANQQAVTDLEKKISTSIADKLLAQKIRDGINAGVTGAQATASFQANRNNQEYLRDVRQRLGSKDGVVSAKEREYIKQTFGIKQGGKKGDQGYAQNIDNYLNENFKDLEKSTSSLKDKFTNFGMQIKNLSPAIGQAVASLANIGTMYGMGKAATEGTSSLQGATTGSMVGTGVGAAAGLALAAVGVPPQIGMMIGSSLGGLIGTFAGKAIGKKLNEEKYGLGSDSSIKEMKEVAESIGQKASEIISENTKAIKLGEEYVELSKKIALTNEEKERFNKLNNQLISDFPELMGNYNEEIGANEVIINQLKEQIKLKKEQNALEGIKSSTATAAEEIGTIIKKNTDKNQENYKKIIQTFTDSFNMRSGILLELDTNLGEVFGENNPQILDPNKISPQNLEQYKESIINFFEWEEKTFGENRTTNDIKELFNNWQLVFDEQGKEIGSKLEKVTGNISDVLDTAFTGISDTSFAAKNKGLIGEQLKYMFSTDEIMEALFNFDETTGQWVRKSEEEIDEAGQEILNTWLNTSENLIESLNNLSESEQEVFSNAFKMLPLLNQDKIKTYLEKELPNTYEKVWKLIANTPERYINQLKENYKNLTQDTQDYIDNLANQGKQLEAVAFGNISLKLNEEGLGYQKSFQEAFTNLINSSTLSTDQINKAIQEIGKTDITSANSMAKLSISLKDIIKDEETVNNLTNNMGSWFNKSGLTAEEALNDIESQLESVNNLIDILGANLKGSLSLKQIDKMNDLLQDMNGELIQNSQIAATGEGFKFKGDAGGIISSGLKGTQQYFLQMAQNAAATQKYKEELASVTEDEEERNKLEAEAIELKKESNYYLYAEADIRAKNLKASIEAEDKEKQRLYDLIQKYKDLIAEMNRYYNLQRTILHLQNEQESLELDFQLATNSAEAGEIAKNQIFNLAKQQAALSQAKDIYNRELKKLGDFINQKYGEYLTVDDSDNIFQNTDALVNLYKRLEGASEQEAEQIQKTIDEVESLRSSYEGLYDASISASKEYKQNLIEQQKLESQLRQYRINLEKTLRDLILQGMQDEVTANKKKYDKIKNEDQKYLASLKKNIDKRKQLQSDKKQDKEIDTLQKRIALLSRDTSGIYTKEIEELQEQLDEALQEKSNTMLDRLYEQEEAKTQKVADELELRAEFEQNQLDLEYETYEKSNAQIEELMKGTDEDIIKFLMDNNKDFNRATETEKEELLKTWRDLVTQGKVENQVLTDDVEAQKQAIIEKFGEIKTGGIDVYIAAVEKASKTPLVVKTDTSQLEVAITKVNELSEAYKNFIKDQAKAEMDSLLVKIQNAAAEGDFDSAKKLQEAYDRNLELYKQYKGDPNERARTVGAVSYGPPTPVTYGQASSYAYDNGLKQFQEGETQKQDILKNNGIEPRQERFELKTRDGVTPFYFTKSGVKISGEINNWDKTPKKKEILTKYGERVQEVDNNGSTIYVPIRFMNKYPWSTGWVYSQYATGGMVDYTGPAWVDGTKSKPEAFLSAADTANIAKLRDILSKVFDSPKSSSSNISQNQNTGDTYYEFHINIDKMSNDYDVEQMMKATEKYILLNAKYRNVINIGKKK